MAAPVGHSVFPPGVVYIADPVALVSVIGAAEGHLPAIAAGVGAIWYVFAIAEKLVDWWRRWRA